MPQPQYASYCNLQKSLDSRVIAELCSDTGTSNPGSATIATAVLERASSIVQAHARVGGMYTDHDLDTTLAGDGLLVMMTCSLATEMLFQRRAMKIPPAVESQLEHTKKMLEDLRDGRLIFGQLDKAAQAGLPEVAATSQWTNAWYNNVSTSGFFRPRASDIYRGA